MEYSAIGMVEYSSIAKGIGSADAMIKAAAVELMISRTICSGKFINLVTGDVSAVTSSVEAGEAYGAECVIDSFVIANIHPDVMAAMSGSTDVRNLESLGIIEAFSVASLIVGADAAAKAANVRLIEVRLAMALGGKAFVTLTGAVGAVESAVAAGKEVVSKAGMLVSTVVIPSPSEELMRDIL